jgi:ubiquinone biosynthesis protein
VASASIGQVHRARTQAGLAVAVKVQYPDINEIVRIDLAALGRIFWLLHRIAPAHGLDAVFHRDSRHGAARAGLHRRGQQLQRIADNFGKYKPPLPVEFPSVNRAVDAARADHDLDRGHQGVNNLGRLDELGIDRSKLARTIVTARTVSRSSATGCITPIRIRGTCWCCRHRAAATIKPASRAARGDAPTPWLELGGAKLVFLDFGAVAELSPKMRRGIVDVLQAGLTRDTQRLLVAMKDMGFIARGADPQIFERVVDFFTTSSRPSSSSTRCRCPRSSCRRSGRSPIWPICAGSMSTCAT